MSRWSAALDAGLRMEIPLENTPEERARLSAWLRKRAVDGKSESDAAGFFRAAALLGVQPEPVSGTRIEGFVNPDGDGDSQPWIVTKLPFDDDVPCTLIVHPAPPVEGAER